MEPVESVLKNIYQSNAYRKDLSCPHFDDEPSVQEKQHQPRRDNIIPYMGVWYIYKDTEQPQEKEASWNELKLQSSWRQFWKYK